MKVFANDYEVLSIGGLDVENHADGVVIFGETHITKDLAGKQKAQALYEFSQSLVAWFANQDENELASLRQNADEAENLAENSAQNPAQENNAVQTVKNPFA
ncbi:Uncharacterised protein [Moraxella caviae]|nr:hypothetical protein [Moraxella caviae]STZ13854.1 Uncharacterised protein [Moraxella caviae]VEW11188.1 Uncharacterised protein [Moraxella caviae]VEW12046.1 Uncharacterised protein [Moraxella caviae]